MALATKGAHGEIGSAGHIESRCYPPDLLLRFPSVLRDDSDEAFLQLKHVIDLPCYVARRALRTAGNLMDHDVGIRQRKTFAFRACAKEHSRHTRSHPKAVSRHVASEKLHRIIYRESCSHRAARRIDVDVDVLLGVFHLQKEKLSDDEIRNVIVHRRSDEDDTILEQPRIDIVAALAAASLLHHHRNQHLGNVFIRYTHDFSSLRVVSCAVSTLTFAFRKSRVLLSRIFSATSSNASFCCSSLRIFSGEMSYRVASCLMRRS